MKNPIAILLLFLMVIALILAINRFLIFWKVFWVKKEIDIKALFYFSLATMVFIVIFFFMKENSEMLEIPVSKANSTIYRDK